MRKLSLHGICFKGQHSRRWKRYQRILEGVGDNFVIQGLGRLTRGNAQQVMVPFTKRVEV